MSIVTHSKFLLNSCIALNKKRGFHPYAKYEQKINPLFGTAYPSGNGGRQRLYLMGFSQNEFESPYGSQCRFDIEQQNNNATHYMYIYDLILFVLCILKGEYVKVFTFVEKIYINVSICILKYTYVSLSGA